MNEIFPPKMRAFMEEFLGDKRGVLQPTANILSRQIDLTTAQLSLELDFQGDFLYADRNTTGVIDVKFNNAAMPKFPFARHTSVKGFPFNKLYLSWLAQSGLSITLWYGYGAEIIPFSLEFGTMYLAPVTIATTPSGQTSVVVSTTSVQLVAANPNRKYLEINNQDAANDLFLEFNTLFATADASSYLVPPRSSWHPKNAMITNAVQGIRSAVNAVASVNVIQA